MCRDVRDEPRPLIAAPVACSLDSGAYRDRMEEWRRVVGGAPVEQLVDRGRVVRLPVDRAEQVARLVVAEQQCCPFFSFGLTSAGPYLELVVHAPQGAESLIDALLDRNATPGSTCSW